MACSVLVGRVRIHLALPNGATLHNSARNSKRKARPRKERDDQNLRNALIWKVPVTACKSSPVLEEDFAQRRRDAKFGIPQFILLFLCALAALRETLFFQWSIIWQGNVGAIECLNFVHGFIPLPTIPLSFFL